jgi:hypothetical protein
MINNVNFEIKILDDFVNINTLSKNGDYYYKIKKPFEVSIGVFASDIAFFETYNHQLIYCNEKGWLASYLPPFESFNNVIWLKNNYVLFVEYQRGREYKLCILNLEHQKLYYKMYNNGNVLFESIQYLKDEQNNISIHLIYELGMSEFKISESFLKNNYRNNIFSRWYPKIND